MLFLLQNICKTCENTFVAPAWGLNAWELASVKSSETKPTDSKRRLPLTWPCPQTGLGRVSRLNSFCLHSTWFWRSTSVYTYTHTHTHAHIHTYTYSYTHSYTHIYLYLYIYILHIHILYKYITVYYITYNIFMHTIIYYNIIHYIL